MEFKVHEQISPDNQEYMTFQYTIVVLTHQDSVVAPCVTPINKILHKIAIFLHIKTRVLCEMVFKVSEVRSREVEYLFVFDSNFGPSMKPLKPNLDSKHANSIDILCVRAYINKRGALKSIKKLSSTPLWI